MAWKCKTCIRIRICSHICVYMCMYIYVIFIFFLYDSAVLTVVLMCHSGWYNWDCSCVLFVVLSGKARSWMSPEKPSSLLAKLTIFLAHTASRHTSTQRPTLNHTVSSLFSVWTYCGLYLTSSGTCLHLRMCFLPQKKPSSFLKTVSFLTQPLCKYNLNSEYIPSVTKSLISTFLGSFTRC